MEGSLKDLRGKAGALADRIEAANAEAGTDFDFTKVTNMGDGDTKARVEAYQAVVEELNDAQQSIEQLETVQQAGMKAAKARGDSGQPDTPDADAQMKARQEAFDRWEASGSPSRMSKSIGAQFTEHEDYTSVLGKQKKQVSVEMKEIEVKTLFETSAGFAPESTRTGKIEEAALRPIQVTDLIPSTTTGQASVVYMVETVTTTAAAERNEGAAYAEADISYAEASSTVRSLGVSLPVTDEQLDDVPRIRGMIDGRLIFFLQQRVDSQILTGDGSAPNLEGLLNTTGLQTQALSNEPAQDTVRKAMTNVRVTGRARPSAIVMHPNDWQDIRLQRTADGIYIFGNPTDAGVERLWGLPIVESDAITEGTALTGDFAMHSELASRMGVDVQIGFVSDDFTKGKQTIRAGLRTAFVVYRGAAFCTATGI